MQYVEPLVDNADTKLEDVYQDVVRESEEVRIATGYFYLSGFDLVKDDLQSLLDPDSLDSAPMRILMGRQTDRRTVEEVDQGQSLREQFISDLEDDIKELNNAQLGRLERLRDFVAQGLVDIRVRNPEQGYFHAKGACFREAVDDPSRREGEKDKRGAVTIVGSSNFSQTGHRNNIELNLTSQEQSDAQAFEDWFDNQWANSDEFSEEIIDVIENSDRYREWEEQQEQEDDEETEEILGTYLEPFELYKLLAYDALNGNVSTRDSPLYYFQSLGYESAKEKLSQYNGCIISDSVGLGKSFIGSELLRDYRQYGDRCLLIVPANLTDQWRDLLQDATDEDGNQFFGLEVDGTHLDVMSISKFQNLTFEEVQDLREQFDVVLVDEAHRFRNHGKWRSMDPEDDDDYKGTRRHANLRLLRGKTMILLTATPINNSATDLKNLISLFTGENELRNKASLNFSAFDQYIDLSTDRKRIAAGKEEATEEEQRQITERLKKHSDEISQILNEVMVLRTRKHVKEKMQEEEDLEMSFKPPTIHKQEYSLPRAYQPIYRMLPDVMDALHLPHITIKNPKAGGTLKALYKLNLLKRLESSTFAFVQSIQTLHQSERALLGLLEGLPEDEDIDALRSIQRGGENSSIDDFVEGEDAAEDIEQVLEEFGFDATAVRADDTDKDTEQDELADATVGEVITYIREDLTLLAYFLSEFIAEVSENADHLKDHVVEIRQWLRDHNACVLPDVPEDQTNPILYSRSDLSEVDEATYDFYEAIFSLLEFRDPKVDRMANILNDHSQKVLIFTQYRATADYVYRTLVNNPNSPLTEANSAVVKGGDDNKQDVIQRFAPEASGYQQTLYESDENELQYVVATDTLSEGVNLQDVHVVVNYDLPWNPMRIVQRVGRVDRIGSTADKHVHNFYPDGDIEAAIQLLQRLQAKINDIALIVGKENNILDPNEDAILEKAGVETQKTIGELEVEEIESSLRKSREVDDYNDLDDTSKNPLLRNAGSNEDDAFERYLLKRDLNEEFDLADDDFEYAEDYFEKSVDEREFLYTNVVKHHDGPSPGVFAVAHLWFEGDDAPLGRVRRAFYYKPFSGEISERSVRWLNLRPETEGERITEDTSQLIPHREAIEDRLDDRLEEIKQGQVEGVFSQGDGKSKEQETISNYLKRYVIPNHGDEHLTEAVNDHTTVEEWASVLRDKLKGVQLKNTDEDRVLREIFRNDERYDQLIDWPSEEFLTTLQEFVDKHIEASTEYQDTLAKESEVHARLIYWGVIGTS